MSSQDQWANIIKKLQQQQQQNPKPRFIQLTAYENAEPIFFEPGLIGGIMQLQAEIWDMTEPPTEHGERTNLILKNGIMVQVRERAIDIMKMMGEPVNIESPEDVSEDLE